MNKEEKQEKKQKQTELANLFYEMGMPLEVVEQISGLDSREFIIDSLNKKIEKANKKVDIDNPDNYNK